MIRALVNPNKTKHIRALCTYIKQITFVELQMPMNYRIRTNIIIIIDRIYDSPLRAVYFNTRAIVGVYGSSVCQPEFCIYMRVLFVRSLPVNKFQTEMGVIY